MRLFPFSSRIRHPLFPNLAATPAGHARGQVTAIAGTFEELMQAADHGARAHRALFVLTRADESFGDHHRDELWRRFQVPVYILLMDRGGRPAAWECEAQNGLHVAEKAFSDQLSAISLRLAPSMPAESTCPCGRPGAKLLVSHRVLSHAD